MYTLNLLNNIINEIVKHNDICKIKKQYISQKYYLKWDFSKNVYSFIDIIFIIIIFFIILH